MSDRAGRIAYELHLDIDGLGKVAVLSFRKQFALRLARGLHGQVIENGTVGMLERRTMMKWLAMLGVTYFATVCVALAGPTDEAKALFDRYVQLERQFDPAAADLYSDDALIKNKRFYPDGQVRELTIPATQFKKLIRHAMPLAKARGDTNTYSNVTFTEEGSGVRIRATRFSELKKYSSPISLLVAPDSTGRWLIREELGESQP